MSDYLVETEKLMRQLANHINHSLNDQEGRTLEWLCDKGFVLIVFEFNEPGVSYISNAKREDMIKALRETADRLEKNQDIPPSLPMIQ
jgi:hypothetical protein